MTIFSWIIIILIILAMIHGYQLGLVRSLTMLVGRLIVYTFAILLAHKFGSWLYDMFVNGIVANWTATNVPATAMSQPGEFLASAIAFTIIILVGMSIVKSIERSLRFINKIPILSTLNHIGGLLVFGLIVYVEVFFVLQITQTLNIPWYTQEMANSAVAQGIMNDTPYLSEAVYDWWLL